MDWNQASELLHGAVGRKKYQERIRKQIDMSTEELQFVRERGLIYVRDDAIKYIKSIRNTYPETLKLDAFVNNPLLTGTCATSTCCRDCIYSSYKIKPWVNISDADCDMLVTKIVSWIQQKSLGSGDTGDPKRK